MRRENNISGRSVVLFLILATLVRQFVQSSTSVYSVVQGDSMYPTLRHDDVVQTRSLHALPKRGDVIILTDDRGDLAIKRIIGLPGEKVTIFLGFVYVNGQRLTEPYLLKNTYTFKLDLRDGRPGVWKLGDNQYFVLGDNRQQSIDSRHFGPVDTRGIRRIVDFPENALRPEFSDIVLSVSGMPMRKSQMQREGSL